MSLPYSKFVSVSAVVQSPAFTVEKKHMLLAMDNALIGTETPAIEFSGASALTNFRAMFGTEIPEYTAASKYFSFQSKTGAAPDKLVVARWYKTAVAPFIKGSKNIDSVADLKKVSDGSFTITIGGSEFNATGLDFSEVDSYTAVATKIQETLRGNSGGGAGFTSATVAYSPITRGFIITGGETGSSATIGAVKAGTEGTDVSGKLGLYDGEVSQGADAETFAQFCDRIYNANTAGYSITTLEKLADTDITPAVEWLQGTQGNQTINTMVRLVFAMSDKAAMKTLQASLMELSYTGWVMVYDPLGEYVNVLDCAIAATIDYQAINGAVNFNFQPAVGYTPITTVGDVVNYQAGITNLSLAEELDALNISYVYSVGFGTQQQVLYGMGLMAGSFGTEDVQVNESALEISLQTAVMNAFVSLNKLKLQGRDARELIATVITPSFEQFKDNGSIARNGTLLDSDRNSIYAITGNPDAADAVANNGYYFQIADLTAEDIANRRVRIVVCYLCGGVVNKVQITNNIYGA